MNYINAKPMIKLTDNNKKWTLSGRGGIELKTEDRKTFFADNGLSVLAKQNRYGDAYQVEYTIKNTSSDTIKIDHISSGCFDNIGGGLLPWYDKRKFKLHICFFTWQGEAQWRETSLFDMGLYKASNHCDVNAIRLRSVGNQSTAVYYPQIFIEDKELNKTYFFEILSTSNWYIEISGNADGTLSVELNSAFANNDNWFLNLESGGEYTASPCIYGVTNGSFEEAVEVMTECRRSISKIEFDACPVCFNDYMNCLWAMPDEKKLIPLIDKAAEVGCEIFCIDDGWQKPLNSFNRALGDWNWNDERFESYGFKGIIAYIKEKGMVPGVWLEMNSIAQGDSAFEKFKDSLLKRNGEYAGSEGCYQIDFRQDSVIEYMTSVIDRLYETGVRFIKNDFNQTIGIGTDGRMCGGEEVRQSSLAFIHFIDMIKSRYPDLKMENCASGSMRTDGSIMKHFELVSISDQEYYYNNPSILSGIQACVQPEKCGIWAYPYPQLFDDRLLTASEAVDADSERNTNKTVFNMINSMMGVMYLSGHIELADDKNTKLIRDAISLYKERRGFIKSAYPIYPCGRFAVEEKGFYAYGLADKKRDKILLAVWRINSAEDVEVFELSKYLDGNYDARVIYPAEVKTDFAFSNGKLSVKLDDVCAARLFEIAKK